MGRPRKFTKEERRLRINEKNLAYYYKHREEILRKRREQKTHSSTKNSVLEVLNEWNEEIHQKLQETLPKWIRMTLESQLQINGQYIQERYKGKNRKP